MADTLHITDGTTTIDIDDPTSDFSLKFGGWAPKVAKVRRDSLGNKSPIEDVDEEMVLTIKGATASAVMANVEALTGLIEKGRLWWEGRQEAPLEAVEIIYEISDSTLAAPLRAFIIGPAKGAIITHPNHFDALEDGLSLSPVTLRFRRHGEWRGSTNTEADTAVAQESIVEITFDESFETPCPYTIEMAGVDIVLYPYPIMLLLSEDAAAGSLEYKEGETGTKHIGDGSIASQADVSADARAGSVGRITRTTGAVPVLIKWTLGNVINQRIVAIFAAIRVNQNDRTWTMEAYTQTDHGQQNTITRPKLVLDGADSTSPQVVFLGYSIAPSADAGHEELRIRVDNDDPTASDTLDIDCIVVLGMDRPYSRSITIVPDDAADSVDEIHVAPWDLTRSPHPVIWLNSVTELFTGWRGDAYLCSAGDKLSAMFLCCGPFAGSQWVATDSLGAPQTIDWDFVRTRAYLAPQ